MRLNPAHPAAVCVCLALLAFIPSVTLAQPGRAAYLEVGGPGGLYSLNADGQVASSGLTLRGGATTWATNVDLARIGMTGVFGGVGRNWDASDFFSQGPGRLIETSAVVFAGGFEDSRQNDPRSGTLVMIVPSVGLRYQPEQRGWMFRAVVTPYIPLTGENPIGNGGRPALGAGLSGGYVF